MAVVLKTWLIIVIGSIMCLVLSGIFGVVIFLIWRRKQEKKVTNQNRMNFSIDRNHNDAKMRDRYSKTGQTKSRPRPTISVCTPGREGAVLHVVRHAFRAYKDEHLNLTIGQIVQVLGDSFIGEDGEHWYLGTIDDRIEGVFPCDAVTMMSLSSTHRLATPTFEHEAYGCHDNYGNDNQQNEMQAEDDYENYLNGDLTPGKMNGLVNQIFTISDESLDCVQLGDYPHSQQHHHPPPPTPAAAPQRVHTPSHLDSVGLSSLGSPVNHSSLDVDIPTRDEFGCYGDEPLASFYQNVGSVKNGVYIDRGEDLDMPITIVDGDNVFCDNLNCPSSGVVIESDEQNVEDDNVGNVDPGADDRLVDYVDLGNTYDVIHDHDINHYDEIYQSRPKEEPKWYVAVNSFVAQYDGQLALRPGDQLIVALPDVMDISVDDGEKWLTGESLTTGLSGCFPRRCVVAMTEKIDSRTTKSKYKANEAAKSSYETIYDHRDTLKIANQKGLTNSLPDLVNNPSTDQKRNPENFDEKHIYGNVKHPEMSLDRSEDAYLMPYTRSNGQTSPIPFSRHQSPIDDLDNQCGYKQSPAILHKNNDIQAPAFHAPSLPLQHNTNVVHNPKTLAVKPNASSTWIPESKATIASDISNNAARLVTPLSTNETPFTATTTTQPARSNPQASERTFKRNITPPSLPVKPKRNSVLLNQLSIKTPKQTSDTPTDARNLSTLDAAALQSLSGRLPPAYDHAKKSTSINQSRHLQDSLTSPSSSLPPPVPINTSTPITTRTSNEPLTALKRPYAAVSPQHVVSPQRSTFSVNSPTHSVAPLQQTGGQPRPISHIAPLQHTSPSPDIVRQPIAPVMPISLSTSARLFTPIGYTKPAVPSTAFASKPTVPIEPNVAGDSPDDSSDYPSQVDESRSPVSKPVSDSRSPPNFYKRTGGTVRPLKFAPIRFSPKTTPTSASADQSFDFIDSSMEVLPEVPNQNLASRTAPPELPTSPPPALPTSPPPDF